MELDSSSLTCVSEGPALVSPWCGQLRPLLPPPPPLRRSSSPGLLSARLIAEQLILGLIRVAAASFEGFVAAPQTLISVITAAAAAVLDRSGAVSGRRRAAEESVGGTRARGLR